VFELGSQFKVWTEFEGNFYYVNAPWGFADLEGNLIDCQICVVKWSTGKVWCEFEGKN
jgi:hypothetical protein